MDQGESEMENLLKAWDLEQLTDVCNEQHIDMKSLHLMTFESLNIILQIGLRLRFWEKIQAFTKPVVFKNLPELQEENLSLVAKLIPELEFYQVIFNIQWTFKNERKFYDTIVPCLQQFQKEQGIQDVIEFYPKYFGARYNLEDTEEKIDGNAVLLLENLKVKGFTTENRKIGFDLPTTKLLLGEIAKFHAVPLALKLKHPLTFENKVKPYLAAFHPESMKPTTVEMETFLLKVIKESETHAQFAPQVEKSLSIFGKRPKTFREPYSTLTHKDLWVNNIMLRHEHGRVAECKFVDFQMYSYDTPAMDLFFFLFASVRKSVIAEHLDYFIEYYHRVFVETLKNLQCDTTPFSHKLFLEEMATCAERELGHTLFMSVFIVIGLEGGLQRTDPTKPPNMEGAEISDENRERVFLVLDECKKRGWLNF